MGTEKDQEFLNISDSIVLEWRTKSNACLPHISTLEVGLCLTDGSVFVALFHRRMNYLLDVFLHFSPVKSNIQTPFSLLHLLLRGS